MNIVELLIDYIVGEIIANTFDTLKKSQLKSILRERIENYFNIKLGENEFADLNSEIDMDGLKQYVSSDKFKHNIQHFLFTPNINHKDKKQQIANNAAEASAAKIPTKINIVKGIIDDVLDIFYKFYCDNLLSTESRFVLATAQNEIENISEELNNKLDFLFQDLYNKSQPLQHELTKLTILGKSYYYIERNVLDNNIKDAITNTTNYNNVIFVTGSGGTGKSISCRWNIYNLSASNNINVIEIEYLTINIEQRIKQLIRRALNDFFQKDIEGEYQTHYNFMKQHGFNQYINELSKNKLIIYIDNYKFPKNKNYSDIEEFLNTYNNLNITIIVSCRENNNIPNNYCNIEINDQNDLEFKRSIFLSNYSSEFQINQNKLDSFFNELESLNNPFVIKFLAKCYDSCNNANSANKFLNKASSIIKNSNGDYAKTTLELLKKYFIKSRVFETQDLCILHFISICYGRITMADIEEFRSKSTEKNQNGQYKYKNHCDIEKYFQLSNKIKLVLTDQCFDERTDTVIDVHDILVDALNMYVEQCKNKKFNNAIRKFYSFILSFFLHLLAFGRVGVYDRHAIYIMPTIKLAKYLDKKYSKVKEYRTLIIEMHNNLSYLQTSIQRNFNDVIDAKDNSETAYKRIVADLEKFELGNNVEYFTNCKCQDCVNNCTNKNMRWACYYKENIYANVYAKSLANSYFPFCAYSSEVFCKSCTMALSVIDTSLDKYNSKIKDLINDTDKALQRRNEFTYTKALIHYKMSCLNIKREENLTKANEHISENLQNINLMLKSLYPEMSLETICMSECNDSVNNLKELLEKLYIPYKNNVNSGCDEIKNFALSVLLYCLILSINIEDGLSCKILNLLDVLYPYFDNDSQRQNTVSAAKAIINLSKNNLDAVRDSINNILSNLTRESYVNVVLLLQQQLFEKDDSYIKRFYNSHDDFYNYLRNKLSDFYDLTTINENMFKNLPYSNLCKYLIIT